MKRGHRLPMNCGGEMDALTRWRHCLCVFYNNTGLSKYWKRNYNKRIRKHQKNLLDEHTVLWHEEWHDEV